MRALGAKQRAYCVSTTEDDDLETDLAQALNRLVGREVDALVLAVGAGVAYYENHEGEQFLLHATR
jgi:hypothetical protein